MVNHDPEVPTGHFCMILVSEILCVMRLVQQQACRSLINAIIVTII